METWLKFVEGHIKLILILVGFGVLFYLGNRFLTNQHDELIGKNAIAQQALAEQVEQNKQLAVQVEMQKKQYEQLALQLTAQNKLLLSAIESRNQQTATQQTNDANLSQDELALRWEQLIQAPTGEIKAEGERLSASGQSALKTVQTLELVAPQQATIADQKVIITNKDQQIAGLTGLNTSLTAQVSGCQKEIIDTKNACKTEVNLVKSKARRSKVKWFITGMGTGAAIAIKFVLF